MGSDTVAIRYSGGGSLTFGDSAGARRTVRAGEVFSTDPETTEILLRDPAVAVAVPGQVAGDPDGETPEPLDLTMFTVAQLKERAVALGLSVRSRASKDELIGAVAAGMSAQPEPGPGNEGGTPTPGEDPDAPASGEPGTPPAERVDAQGDPVPPPAPASVGAITLGDLPAGAKLAPGRI